MLDSAESLLLRRLVSYDATAWRELVQMHTGLLLALARRTFHAYGHQACDSDCEDAVAEVWRNLLANDRRLVRQCAERGQLLPLLCTLVRNRSVDQLRRNRLVLVEENDLDREYEPPEPPELPPVSNRRLKESLAVLSARERTLVELFFLQERKYREITLLTGIPQNSIGPTLARALAKLRKVLDKDVE